MPGTLAKKAFESGVKLPLAMNWIAFRYKSLVGSVLLKTPVKKTSLFRAHAWTDGVRTNDKSACAAALETISAKPHKRNDFKRTVRFPHWPTANKIPLLMAYTVPSTPISVGV